MSSSGFPSLGRGVVLIRDIGVVPASCSMEALFYLRRVRCFLSEYHEEKEERERERKLYIR